jgi:hypothetical protein
MTTIYGVDVDDTLCFCEGKIAKNKQSYWFAHGHPAYGCVQRVPIAVAVMTRDDAVAAWRAKLTAEVEMLRDRIARIEARLERGVKDERRP